MPRIGRDAVLYDAFISHASEDKADFVRPLAERLREEHIEVWYDEFTLRVGDSLRRSIDKGLSQSRFGVVVLSPSFFAKGWPQRELDGLVAREIEERGILLPIWHGVTREEVLAYSPPLADKLAASSASGIEQVVSQLCDVIRPQGSTLVIARDHLIELGYTPPVVTDDWWLDVAAASESNDMEGGWQSAMGWGRWGFRCPRPHRSPLSADID
jgi:TIR domain